MRFLVEHLFFSPLSSGSGVFCCVVPLVLNVPRSYKATRESDDDREARGSVAGVKVVAWVPTRSFPSFRIASKGVAVVQHACGPLEICAELLFLSDGGLLHWWR